MKLKDLPKGEKMYHINKLKDDHHVILDGMQKIPGAKGLYMMAKTQNGKEKFMGTGEVEVTKFGDYWHWMNKDGEHPYHEKWQQAMKKCECEACKHFIENYGGKN